MTPLPVVHVRHTIRVYIHVRVCYYIMGIVKNERHRSERTNRKGVGGRRGHVLRQLYSTMRVLNPHSVGVGIKVNIEIH